MPKSLVIVESPTKAKTINKYLGKDYEVEASLGHIKDLPKSQLGVDLEGDDFSTEYVVIPGKEKVVAKLKKMAKGALAVYLAPDPDREGEAIAAHLEEELSENGTGRKKKKGGIEFRRVLLTRSPRKRCRRHSSIRETSTEIWWMRSRRVACWTALWVIKSRRCCGTKFVVGFLPDAYRPSRCA